MRNFFILTLCLFSLAVLAEDHPKPPRDISVSGQAKSKLKPDMATIRFAIINTNKDAEKARVQNEETAKDVLNSARELGLTDEQMQLESLNINEDKEYNAKTQQYDSKGYKAQRSFVVELYELNKLSGLIAAVVSSGSNELNSVEYGLKNPEKAKQEALEAAVENAKTKADLMLKPLNETTGKVLHLEEVSNNFWAAPRGMKRMVATTMAFSADEVIAEPDAYSSGQIEVEASVRAVFTVGVE